MEYRRKKLAKSNDGKYVDSQAKPDGVVSTPSRKQLYWKEEYLANQKRLLDLYDEDRLSVRGVKKKNEDEREEDRMLASACLALNVASLIGNLVASVLSGSLSVLSTFVDSAMDISCSVVMNLCLQLINQTDTFNYPRGRER
uniref:Metal tolerance protein 7 n=1 Tax=Heterorhabditis bacteriophora TaxID=37862 RepID=A0A1I7WN53_HETBA